MKNNLQSRGFKALLVTQFLGAFNDNAFRFVVALIAIDQYAGQPNGTKILSLSGAVFIFPYLLFSTYAGFLADRLSKQRIIVRAKLAELMVMMVGLIAIIQANIWALLAVLFFMGTQSAFFSPSKWGILPEILSEEEISEGNGLIQLWTNAAIILGTACGGLLTFMTRPYLYQTSFVFIAISLLGIVSSFFVTPVIPSGSKRPWVWNFLGEIVRSIQKIRKDRAVFLSIMGLMYFGFLGALFQLNILLYAKNVLAVNDLLTGVLLTFLATGIGAGGVLAGKFSDRKIELGLVPLGAIGLSIFCILLGFVHHSFALVSGCLFFMGLSAGFYIVPLNALIQQNSPVDQRGEVLAANNFLSFLAMLAGSGMITVFRDYAMLNAAEIFIAAGGITILGTGYICRLLPYALIRFIVWLLTHTLYQIRVIDREHVPAQGGALLVSNHVSLVDALLILVSLPRPVRFMINRDVYHSKIFHPLFRLSGGIPILNSDSPREIARALNAAKEAIVQGELVCIFAEGQLTRTGNILRFNKGFEHIMKNVDCPIIPVHLDRVWGSIFSFERGKYYYKIPKMIPYPVTVSFGTPMPHHAKAFEVRSRVMELGSQAFSYRLVNRSTLPEAFWKEARKQPFRFCVADSSGRKLTFAGALIGSVALSQKLQDSLKSEENVGVMIPPSVAGLLVNVAVSILHKVPVNLNYTGSQESIISIAQQCRMKYVITSRRFAEKINLSIPGTLIYVEDLAGSITLWQKIQAAVKAMMPLPVLSHLLIFGRNKRSMSDLATIMFTSGSTGNPKGVMLTHANITSNLEGLYQVFHVHDQDMMMGVLPFFHSFGFTATVWFPLISGIGAVYHHNPMDAKIIGKCIEEFKVTTLMSTPTFLSAYTRRCTKEQFASLRLVVVGAEKLKEQAAEAFKEKFGIEPMEGYGCTELSPIVSINLPDYRGGGATQKAHKPGKIGLPLPGIAVKIVDQETEEIKGINENGLLYVRGPNVMKGYLNRDDLTREVIEEVWYRTGDVANIDEDGFLMITDRLSRFSKIAGEMVPHIKIEEAIQSILKSSEQSCVVTSLSDEKKGEKLAVLFTGDGDPRELIKKLQESDLPKLWIPSGEMFFRINSIPLLGTGKVDLGAVKQKARELVAK